MGDGRVAVAALPFAALLMAAAQQPMPKQGAEQTIGVATQEADGTIVLRLRAEGEGGGVGDAQVRYAPADKDHAMIARHVGPIPRGRSVPVRPFAKQ